MSAKKHQKYGLYHEDSKTFLALNSKAQLKKLVELLEKLAKEGQIEKSKVLNFKDEI